MFILHIALQGCLRSAPIAYGVTPDTGGHIRYVLELCDAHRRKGVERQLIVTRRFRDHELGKDYFRDREEISEGVGIARIDGACPDYLPKEELFREHFELTGNFLDLLGGLDRLPDMIHAHYADAAILAMAAKKRFGIPFFFTPHSLGRVKAASCESRRNDSALRRRIEVEELAVAEADRIVVSSRDEAEHQLALYKSQRPERVIVNPPGCDMDLFAGGAPSGARLDRVKEMVSTALKDPLKPPLLALARPVAKKNLAALVHAYGQDEALQEKANLVIFAGVRDDLARLDEEGREVLQELLYLQDKYDLYGKMVLPKQHELEDVPAIYSWAAALGGVFCNPALNEPFGLTLLEAAASGLPVVSTDRGGPVDIVGKLQHGVLIDPVDHEALAAAATGLIEDRELWAGCAKNGRERVTYFSWDRHAADYLQDAHAMIRPSRLSLVHALKRDFMVISDIDDTLVGERESLASFARLRRTPQHFYFAIATGRSLQDAIRILREWNAPPPEVLVTSVGSEIYYARDLDLRSLSTDEEWEAHIAQGWDLGAVAEALADVPGLTLQPAVEQRRYKRSYFIGDDLDTDEVRSRLVAAGIRATVIRSHETYLDVLPARVSKGKALAFLARKLDLPLSRTIAAGDSGNDRDLLLTAGRGVVVANHRPELLPLKGRGRTYFAQRPYAGGILEAIERFGP